MEILFSPTLDPDLKKIFWHVFFETKQRGISLSRHFPWIDAPETEAVFISARDTATVTGGLVLRTRNTLSEGKPIKVGMLGLVCVREQDRGRGISKALLTAAIDHAREEQFDYLTLWTSQHVIYEKFGFRIHDQWLYGSVGVSNGQLRPDAETAYLAVMQEDLSLPLPPYANNTFSYHGDGISIALLSDANGVIVASYQGDPSQVAKVLLDHLPACWRLNIPANDALLAALEMAGKPYLLRPVNLQMWLPVKTGHQALPLPNIIIPLLDRI